MATRLALFSDVHANLPALEAVLSDIERAGIAGGDVYCLGDLVGYGSDPNGVVERMRGDGIATVRGNYDDGIVFSRGECGCYYPTPEAKAAGAETYAATDAAITAENRAWLAGLPDELRLERDGVRILLVHGSPRKINEYLLLDRTDDFLSRLAEGANADVICVGHVHVPYHRVVTLESGAQVHWVSDGSAGKPKDGDPRPCWVELAIGSNCAIATTVHRAG